MSSVSKDRRIGGEFEMGLCFPPASALLDCDIFGDDFTWFNAGRSALAKAINVTKRERHINNVWLPYYTCKSVVLPFVSSGLKVHFYSQGDNLQTAPTLPPCLNDTIVLFNHYFGQINRPLCDYLARGDHANIVVIEDAVQTCMDMHTPAIGDFVVHVPRKFLPVPDGAALQSDWHIAEPEARSDDDFIATKILAKQMRGHNDERREAEGVRLNNLAEARLDTDTQIRSMSAYTKAILPYFDFKSIRAKRRENWECLADIFSKPRGEFSAIHPLFTANCSDTTPLVFPILADKRDRAKIMQRLVERRIFCPQHWPISKPQQDSGLPDYELSQRLFGLPIDQRYGTDDMQYVVQSLAEVVVELGI